MIITGLTKMKLGDVFNGMNNITIATSSGLIYSWGANMASEDFSSEEQRGSSDSNILR